MNTTHRSIVAASASPETDATLALQQGPESSTSLDQALPRSESAILQQRGVLHEQSRLWVWCFENPRRAWTKRFRALNRDDDPFSFDAPAILQQHGVLHEQSRLWVWCFENPRRAFIKRFRALNRLYMLGEVGNVIGCLP
ncbi:unnamed protein product [Effrenium voratum]|uniref:Uncharacterized protein n=1 Tax=Effrenium voratum TaxID=2562239 RepID=A0AA36NH66_9DINO|nr:unnamed protein product [Effrenium voratum]